MVSFICYILRTIHTLKFQAAWNELPQRERTKYLDHAFEYLCEDDIRHMRLCTPAQKQESQWKKMRKAFGKAYQRKTTTRNYILHLYQKVKHYLACSLLTLFFSSLELAFYLT